MDYQPNYFGIFVGFLFLSSVLDFYFSISFGDEKMMKRE